MLNIDGLVVSEVEVRESLARRYHAIGYNADEARRVANMTTEFIFELWGEEEQDDE